MDFSKIESSLYGDVEDDGDLLAELMELENEEKRKVQSSNQKRAPARNLAAAPARGRGSGLDPKALSEALRDIPDDDGDISDGIEDDEELLGELADLVSDDEAPAAPRGTPSVPQAARAAPATPAKDNGVIAKLKDAENAYKKMKDGAAGNSSKIRRYDRALTKIAELTKKAERGIAVDPLEIPVLPNQGIGEASKDPQASEAPRPGPPPVPNRMASIEKPLPPALPPRVVQVEKPELPTRKPEPMEEKTPTSSATSDSAKLLALLQSRRVAYLQNAHTAAKADDKVAAGEFVTVAKQFDEAIKAVNEGLLTECDEDEIPPMPQPYKVPPSKLPPPKTLAEDLKQRMEAFHQLTAKYKSEGNERKTRMNYRIVQNYQEAIREVSAGRAYDFTDLPPPPGFEKLNPATYHTQRSPQVAPAHHRPLPAMGPTAAVDPRAGGSTNRQVTQLQFLLNRQKQFKEAAIHAKQKGDMAAAKKYLMSAKGFDQMIEASRSGLPVDIRKIPTPPQMATRQEGLKPTIESQKSLLGNEDALIAGNTQEIYASMERDLIRQVKLCDNNRVHFQKLGDVSRVKLYETMLAAAKRDLLQLRAEAKSGNPPPRYRYETREFPSVDMNADIPQDVVRVVIVGADEVKMPSGYKPTDGNIYITYDFPFPHENHQTGKTKLVAGTDSPRFNETVDFTINRKARQLQRVIKRTGIKFEVYQKGGFLRSDKLLGTAEFKINDLEIKATVDGIVSLMDGRKTAGGRIAVSVKAREPLGETTLNVIKEKWLVIVS